MDYGQSPPEMVSLAEVKRQVPEMEAKVASGAGVPGFRDCIHYKMIGDRDLRAEPWTPPEAAVDIPSGSAAWTEIYRKSDTDGESEYHRYWLSGPDAGMFQALRVDDDTIPRNGYEHMLVTARPLPGGEYAVLYNWQPFQYFPCNFVPDEGFINWTVTVVASLGTLHEAFFDPVADGAAVGYTAGVGRLEPAAFDLRGTSVRITALLWEEGSVSLTVDPPGGLSQFALEFIELDGTTSRILSGGAATEDSGTGTITWQVSVPIWEDGDLVLLRIIDGGGDPSPTPGATATPEPTPASTPEPTPEATATPVPMESPSPAGTQQPGGRGRQLRRPGWHDLTMGWLCPAPPRGPFHEAEGAESPV